MSNAFHCRDTVLLTSTTSSQTVSVPGGSVNMVVYNAAANPVYLKFAGAVTAPGATFGGASGNTMVVQPSTTQTFAIPNAASTLAYMAVTAGGSLFVSIGSGV